MYSRIETNMYVYKKAFIRTLLQFTKQLWLVNKQFFLN